jgi:hypothetical protein
MQLQFQSTDILKKGQIQDSEEKGNQLLQMATVLTQML